jgi:hypothetical protein
VFNSCHGPLSSTGSVTGTINQSTAAVVQLPVRKVKSMAVSILQNVGQFCRIMQDQRGRINKGFRAKVANRGKSFTPGL